MRSNLLVIASVSLLAACNSMHDMPDQGVASVNVPVVATATFTFDAAAPGGSLAPGEAERLNGFFQSLDVGYGDSIYVDGAPADRARAQVAEVAGRYGLLIQAGSPITAGYTQPDTVRVVVNRRRASLPNCPNWSVPSQPNFDNRSMSNFGCGVNSNLAAMVADPVDLIHGREGDAVIDAATSTKAIEMYRKTAPTGAKKLENVNTKGN